MQRWYLRKVPGQRSDSAPKQAFVLCSSIVLRAVETCVGSRDAPRKIFRQQWPLRMVAFRPAHASDCLAITSGNLQYISVNKLSATLNSSMPEVGDNNVTCQRIEEETLEGCCLQHGEMTADGFTIHYVEAGDPAGKLVVLLHGFPNFWYVWKYQFQPLVEAGYHVIAPDLRGYNRSSKPATVEEYSRSAVLSDIVKLIDHFGGGKPAITVGHDWGATITWSLAEDYPSKVERLVTVNMSRLVDFRKILISSFNQMLKSWYMFFFQIPVLPEYMMTPGSLKFILKSTAPSATDEDIRRHVAAYSNPGAVKGGISYYRAVMKGLWSREDKKVPVINKPVTVIWGDQDSFLLPINADANKAEAPNAKIVHLPKCSHWPMWDEPSLFNELLLEAISKDGGL